ncbi:MAG: T9SS type A sorting domain-containing protein, partial [Sphingobacteriales bacterium]
MYPNPNAGAFSLELPDYPAEPATAIVYDVTGKALAQQQLHKKKQLIRLPDLPDGLYLLQVLYMGEAFYNKLLIRK